MIPKIIHYCWFGRNPLPTLAQKCIASWKKYFPDYEIKEWNEDNFDVNIITYTRQAYEAKKYAFVSDYARFWILYNYGGIYFDTDVEVIKNMEDILAKGNYMGKENTSGQSDNEIEYVNPGLGFAMEPKHPLLKEVLEIYRTYEFINKDGSLNTKTIVTTTTDLLLEHGYSFENRIQIIDNILIYPSEYFSPKNYYTGKLVITSNTYSIHHYDASWKSGKQKFKKKFLSLIGGKCTNFLVFVKHIFIKSK